MSASAKLLVRAARYLRTAEALVALGDYESAVSRAYYAMFYAARAALAARGVEARTHAGVVSAFGQALVKPGAVDRTHLAALSRALNDRLLAEYDEDLRFSRAQAEEVRRAAEAFVAAVRALSELRPDAPEV